MQTKVTVIPILTHKWHSCDSTHCIVAQCSKNGNSICCKANSSHYFYYSSRWSCEYRLFFSFFTRRQLWHPISTMQYQLVPPPLPHYHIKLERSMKKVKTRLVRKGNEHRSHVIMKEWMQETVVKCVFFSRVNDDWYRHVIIVIISIASCSVHMHASSLPQAAPNYSTYRSADAPRVLCLRCWCVEERCSAAARAHLSSFAEL